MNHIMFGAKQVFLGTIRFTRDLVRRFKLTPARYNMMYAIAMRRGGIAQRELRDVLGLAKPTIWKMLKSLEQLGFLKRTPHPRNSRHRWVSLTPSGNFHIANAIENTVEEQALSWMTLETVSPSPESHEPSIRALCETDTLFNRMRERLDDFATLRFAYDPDCDELLRDLAAGKHERSMIENWEAMDP